MYTSPHQFEPLLPSAHKMDPLLAKAHQLALAASGLAALRVPSELRQLLRSMNSYYTNRIEGQHTRPREIEQALRHDFSTDKQLAAKQRLALAHIEAETELEVVYHDSHTARRLYSADALQLLHATLFGQLPVEDLTSQQGVALTPGQFRNCDVQVGLHVAPSHEQLLTFIRRWCQVYDGSPKGDAALVALAAAHQRLGWIHPFVDGNGRVMRLHSHLWLTAMGYTGGLWSPLRGFARTSGDYYALLAASDEPRRCDLDGRGNLSEAALIQWIEYFLDMCLDQVLFMRGLLDLGNMKNRLEACLVFESNILKSGIRTEAIYPLHYLYLSGDAISRGDFKAMLGTSERTGTDAISALIKRGLLKSDSPQGKVRFGLPQHALRFLFPKLWPEAEVDE